MVLLAFALTSGRSSNGGSGPTSTAQPTGVLGPLTEAPVTADAATTVDCAKVISQLPASLNGRLARLVRGGGPLVKAWGQPPVVLKCGVSRPDVLKPGADSLLLAIGIGAGTDVLWLPANNQGRVFTLIDRAIYVEVDLPDTGSAGDVLPTISEAVNAVLPAICVGQPTGAGESLPPQDKLCVYRK